MGLEGFECFQASVVRLQKSGGLGGGGGAAPPTCKHSARIMGLEGPRMLSSTVLASWVRKGLACFEASNARLKKKKSGGVGGGAAPPHFQTQCSHHGFGGLRMLSRKRCPASEKWGVGGGAAPPICKHSARIMGLEGPRMLSSTVLASWVRKGLACFEASNARLKKKKAGGLGGAQPPHFQTQCSHHGFGGLRMLSSKRCPASEKWGVGGGCAAPPICKHSARIMGLEGPRMLSSTVLASWVWKGLACFEASVAWLKKKSSVPTGTKTTQLSREVDLEAFLSSTRSPHRRICLRHFAAKPSDAVQLQSDSPAQDVPGAYLQEKSQNASSPRPATSRFQDCTPRPIQKSVEAFLW